ncbi:hypothetical protein, partial [Neisseria mucosa]|uniref:hypothetical protein n=1 Tax=Neisseria mucosa TaxID=488 RepID=UPI00280A6FC3
PTYREKSSEIPVAVIPAQAGIHRTATGKQKINKAAEIHQWIPACAGMTAARRFFVPLLIHKR